MPTLALLSHLSSSWGWFEGRFIPPDPPKLKSRMKSTRGNIFRSCPTDALTFVSEAAGDIFDRRPGCCPGPCVDLNRRGGSTLLGRFEAGPQDGSGGSQSARAFLLHAYGHQADSTGLDPVRLLAYCRWRSRSLRGPGFSLSGDRSAPNGCLDGGPSSQGRLNG